MINLVCKVRITEEAMYDYEFMTDGKAFPKFDIKSQTEEYIQNMKENGKLEDDGYFKVKYSDEISSLNLLLFFYKGRKNACMQEYDLCGICEEKDWDESLEYSGAIRKWLRSTLDTSDKTDWVLDYRLKERQAQRELELEEKGENYGEDYFAMVKNLLKNYRINKKRIAVADKSDIDSVGLSDKMEFLDKCINSLDTDAKDLIRAIYIEGLSLKRAGVRFSFSKTSIFRKRDRAIAVLELLFSERYEI